MSTSYSNSGGTGDRTATITVTTDLTLGGSSGTAPRLVDGNKANGSGNAIWFTNGQAVSGKQIVFDFGALSKIIDEAKWYQNGTVSGGQGQWKWQGWNGSSWGDLSTSFELNGGSTGSVIGDLSANATGYVKYRLLGVSGNTNDTPWLWECEFKIDAAPVVTTGTLTATEANDTAALTGDAAWTATLATTETNDTAQFITAAIITGTLAATEQNDTASFDDLLFGTLAATETADTAAVTGSISWLATLSTTEATDTAAMTGQVTAQPTGTLAHTEPNDTAAFTGYIAIAGTLAATEASDTAALNGQGIAITGTLVTTEAPDILVFNEPDIYSLALAVTEEPDTAAFVGTFRRHPNTVVIVCNN